MAETREEFPQQFKPGQLVTLDGEIYDFGYYTNWGCVLYSPGERNMQDSIAVPVWRVKLHKEAASES